MHPHCHSNNSAIITHTAEIKKKRGGRDCPSCNIEPVCKSCNSCPGCTCKCHQSFALRYRFMLIEQEESLLAEVEKSVVDNESLTSSSSSTAIVNNGSPRHDLSFCGMHGTSKGGLMAGKVSSLCTIQKWF